MYNCLSFGLKVVESFSAYYTSTTFMKRQGKNWHKVKKGEIIQKTEIYILIYFSHIKMFQEQAEVV